GEYETLTLDCPAFKKQINLYVQLNYFNETSQKNRVETEVVIQDDKDFATVAYLRIKSATLQTKAVVQDVGSHTPNLPLLGDIGQYIYSITRAAGLPDPVQRDVASTFQMSNNTSLQPSIQRIGNWIAIGSISCGTEGPVTIEDQTLFSFQLLKGDNFDSKSQWR
ncbi:4500_t:CDS:1, partial [Acaulospora colombiana]